MENWLNAVCSANIYKPLTPISAERQAVQCGGKSHPAVLRKLVPELPLLGLHVGAVAHAQHTRRVQRHHVHGARASVVLGGAHHVDRVRRQQPGDVGVSLQELLRVGGPAGRTTASRQPATFVVNKGKGVGVTPSTQESTFKGCHCGQNQEHKDAP
jgi:hypothetical protein